MNPVALSFHLAHVIALVAVIAVFAFLIVALVRWKIRDWKASRKAHGGFVPDEVVRRFMERKRL